MPSADSIRAIGEFILELVRHHYVLRVAEYGVLLMLPDEETTKTKNSTRKTNAKEEEKTTCE